MSQIKSNVFWSSLLTTLNYIFPLITYPYVSRVLGVTNIGICNFVDGIIQYYSLFAMMGISFVAIREIAANKGDKDNLSKTFSSLLSLNLLSTLIMIIALVVSIEFVPKFKEYSHLLYVGVVKLLFNSLLVEWLYKGIEDFKFITIRALLIRCIYVVFVFILVRDASDYPQYYLLSCLTIVLNALVNCIYAKKHVRLSFKGISLKSYFKPFLILGIYQFLTSLYKTFNIVFLGFVGGEQEVGYYTTATKLHGIILALFSAFTGVMMPRMASLVAEGKSREFNNLFHKSIEVLFAFSMPIMILCACYSDVIIRLIAGEGYEMAIPCMQIVIPLVFIIGYEQILVYQILMPLKQDRCIFINSFIGGMVGILCNVILVPKLYSIGSAFVWLICEFIVLLSAQHFATNFTGLVFPLKLLFRYIITYTPLAILIYALHGMHINSLISICAASVMTVLYFIMIESFINKNSIVISILNKFMSKFKL